MANEVLDRSAWGRDSKAAGYAVRWNEHPGRPDENHGGGWDAESGTHCQRVELPSRRWYIEAACEPDGVL